MATEAENAGRERFVVFVNDVEETWDRSEVLAKLMMERAGRTNTQGYVLEALDHKGGSMVKEFQPDQVVDLREPDRRFFRIVPGGGGYS